MSRRSYARAALPLVLALAGCSSSATPGTDSANAGGAGTPGLGGGGAGGTSGGANAAGASSGGAPSGAIPIVAGTGADVPYQLGMNPYGIQGAAFFARAPMGSDSVVIDKSQPGKICLAGTVEIVPTPADGSHPPYSTYWGIDLGFNLNQSAASDPTVKTPWLVPAGVTGFWFTVEGATIPPLRFKTTPTGRDPAQEQDSCALVTPSDGVPNQVLFTDMYVQCWDGPQGTGTTDISKGLVDVGLQVAAAVEMPFPVDFCLTGFGVITE